MKTIKPAAKVLFVKQRKGETVTQSGIMIAESSVEKQCYADVLGVGDDVKGYLEGDVVIFREYTANEIELDKEKYLLVHVDDVLGKQVEK